MSECKHNCGCAKSAPAKPHLGRISHWDKRLCTHYGLGYVITGQFVDDPDFTGERGRTSYVVKHDELTGEIETRNSRYTLVDMV